MSSNHARSGLAVLAVIVAAGAWRLRSRDLAPEQRTASEIAAPIVPPVSTVSEPAAVLATASLPVRDPEPIDSHAGPVHPHPMTLERDRIQYENQLLGRMHDAVDLADPVRLSDELARYEREFPDDPNQLQSGFRVILACLESPGPTSTASAQRYFDEERGSTLRRFVARHCLGG